MNQFKTPVTNWALHWLWQTKEVELRSAKSADSKTSRFSFMHLIGKSDLPVLLSPSANRLHLSSSLLARVWLSCQICCNCCLLCSGGTNGNLSLTVAVLSNISAVAFVHKGLVLTSELMSVNEMVCFVCGLQLSPTCRYDFVVLIVCFQV